jgi:hypothetical protein
MSERLALLRRGLITRPQVNAWGGEKIVPDGVSGNDETPRPVPENGDFRHIIWEGDILWKTDSLRAIGSKQFGSGHVGLCGIYLLYIRSWRLSTRIWSCALQADTTTDLGCFTGFTIWQEFVLKNTQLSAFYSGLALSFAGAA